MSAGSGIMPDMRVCFRWTVVAAALLVVGCSTVSPPGTTSMVSSEAASFRSVTDAPRVANAIREKLQRSGKSLKDLSASDLDTYAGVLLAAGRLDEADQTLTTLNSKQPGNKETLKTLALLAEARGDGSLAVRVDTFVKTFPGDPEALNLQARIKYAQGDKAGADAAWKASLSKTETRDALEGLVGLALDANQPDDALPLADRALKLEPTDGTWVLHSQVMVALNRGIDARHDLDQAVAMAPNDPWHRIDRARVEWRKQRDAKAARADLEAAIKLDAGNVLSWSLLTEVLWASNQPRPAYDAVFQTLKLREDFKPAYPAGAMLAFRLKDYERAVSFAQLASKDYPGEYAFPLVQALSLQALGKPQDAKTCLEKARPRYARNPTVDELFRFLLTPTSDSFLNTALNQEKNQSTRVRIRYYQGYWYAITGAPASAKAAFEDVASSTLDGIPEIQAANDWLQHGN